MIDKYVVYRDDIAFYVVREPVCPFCSGNVKERRSEDFGGYYECIVCSAVSIPWAAQNEWSTLELKSAATKCGGESAEEMIARLDKESKERKERLLRYEEEIRSEEIAEEERRLQAIKEQEKRRKCVEKRKRERDIIKNETKKFRPSFGHRHYYYEDSCGCGPSWLGQSIVCHVDVDKVCMQQAEDYEVDNDVIVAYDELMKVRRASRALRHH